MTARKSARFRVRRCFSPYPVHYSRAFAFFRVPLPTAPATFLAVRLPVTAALWAYPVPHESPSGADPSSSPAADRPWWPSFQRPLLTAYRFGSSLSARLACSSSRRLAEVHIRWSYPLIPSSSPPSCWQISPCLAARRTGYPAATLSPKLHTEPLPAPRVRVGERLMEQPGSSGHACSCETETHATFRSHEYVLGEIQTDRGNLHVDGSPHVIRLRRTTLWHSMPGAGAVHHINRDRCTAAIVFILYPVHVTTENPWG